MLYSMLIRLAMLAVTAVVVYWIGWTTPTSRSLGSDETSNVGRLDTNVLHSTDPLPDFQTAVKAGIEKPQPRSSRRSVAPVLELNQASERDLEGLPGIGRVLALRIVEYREARGAFRHVDQLRQVKGIGKKTFDRIRAFVRVASSPSVPPREKAA
jgi:competence protein ComEA